jgi:hypothetical protein
MILSSIEIKARKEKWEILTTEILPERQGKDGAEYPL